jgi:hypothetical protein
LPQQKIGRIDAKNAVDPMSDRTSVIAGRRRVALGRISATASRRRSGTASEVIEVETRTLVATTSSRVRHDATMW